jgi:hypothetical protein
MICIAPKVSRRVAGTPSSMAATPPGPREVAALVRAMRALIGQQ